MEGVGLNVEVSSDGIMHVRELLYLCSSLVCKTLCFSVLCVFICKGC